MYIIARAISEYFYDIEVVKKDNDEGWIFNLERKEFKTLFTKFIEEKVFKPHKENAEYYIAMNDSGEEIGLLIIGKQCQIMSQLCIF